MKKSFRNSYRFVALLLVLILSVFFVGCKNEAKQPTTDNSSVASSNNSSQVSSTDSSLNNVSSEDVSSGDISSGDISSDNSNTNNVVSEDGIEPVGGTIEYSSEIIAEKKNYIEVKPELPSANLADNREGYFEKEASQLRNSILNTPNTEEIYKITGKKYYISPNGDDTNKGTSPENAFKTLEPINMLKLEPGDAVLFERGHIYRFNATIVAKKGVTYGSYGKGDKPAIYASPSNYANEKWKPINKANVWKSSYIYSSVVGMVLDHGKIVGVMKNSVLDLEQNGDFFHDTNNDEIYLYCDKGIPSKIYESIEPLSDLLLVNIPSGTGDVIIDNLCLKYTGSFAVSAKYAGENITITNCEIGYIGGREQGNGLRYGNAIEFWEVTKNVKVENNWIYQTFDSAVTWQGREGGLYENISFSNNLFECNNADIEFFEGANAQIKNFKMNNNIMRFTSSGWGTRADDGGIRGIEGCIRAQTQKISSLESVEFKNNIIDCPARQIINWSVDASQLSQILVSDNKFYVNSKYRTTEIIVSGFGPKGLNEADKKAKNAEQFKNAFEHFDKTATLKWY